MSTNLLPTITFILISTFSPGPTNIASAAMGVLHGYRKTVPFLLGLVVGFLCLMGLSAWAAATVLRVFPVLKPILQYVGAVYIFYLAYSMVKASYTSAAAPSIDETTRPLGFGEGFVLQALNPKLIVYGVALFSTFLAPLADQPRQMVFVVPLLALLAFCATSVWALFGALIKAQLRYPRVQLALNGVLALMLVYSALTLAEIW